MTTTAAGRVGSLWTDLWTDLGPDLDPLLIDGVAGAPALVTASETLTYGDLADAVRERVAELGRHRRLVLIEAGNDVATVVSYLAALAGRHPVLMVGADDVARHDELLATYRPDVRIAGNELTVLRTADPESRSDLHPDLALLASTSGSTGSPKLARLSRRNLEANARSVATYLRLGPDDRGVTALPLHYCYGLSVLNSHLVSGASVALTDDSVSQEPFWDLVAGSEVTGVPGVPYTFELLEASGFADRELPRLRYLTQAGGRMPPERVTRFADLGQRRGWDLFLMYGQTEATARMAYLPPHLAATRPHAVGVAVPGGSLRIDPLADEGAEGIDPDVGELVYRGPNVMMGYATTRADLRRGAELAELRTGDLARYGDDGLVEIVGRRSRTAKVAGLRIDLDRVEAELEDAGHVGRLVDIEEVLHLFVCRPRTHDQAIESLTRLTGLPASRLRLHTVVVFPRRSNGKHDDAALRAQARRSVGDTTGGASVRDLYAIALGRPDVVGSDTFVGLGADSLSFVELSTRLARHLGHLPADWPRLSIDELTRATPRRRRFTVPVDLSVVLRALAILMVVTTHTDLWLVPGGAHVLLAVGGYGLARFVLVVEGRRRRCRRLLAALAAVAVPASLWIGACALLTGQYHWWSVLYLNSALGVDRWTADWQFWFLDALVWAYLALAAALACPVLDRWQRAHRFSAAMVVVALTLGARYAFLGVEAEGMAKYSVLGACWVIALGWAAAEATGSRERLLVALTTIVAVHGFFGDLQRELIVTAAVLLLLWSPTVLLPRLLATGIATVAGASLWIYLTHWQVYPVLEAAGHPVAAIAAAVAVGAVAASVYRILSRLWRSSGDRVGLSGVRRAATARRMTSV